MPKPAGHARNRQPFLAWGQDGFKKLAHIHSQVFKVTQQSEALIKAHGQSVEQLLAFIQAEGTPVVILDSTWLAVLCFIFLGWDPGFLAASQRPRFKLLCVLLGRFGLLNKPEEALRSGLFLLTPAVLNMGFVSHQVHHWQACHAQLPGYSDRALDLYKTFWQRNHGRVSAAQADPMTLEELKALRSAMQRDQEALGFLSKLMSEWIAPAHVRLDNGDTLV